MISKAMQILIKISVTYMVVVVCQKSFLGPEEIGLRRRKIAGQKAEGLLNELYEYIWAFGGE